MASNLVASGPKPVIQHTKNDLQASCSAKLRSVPSQGAQKASCLKLKRSSFVASDAQLRSTLQRSCPKAVKAFTVSAAAAAESKAEEKGIEKEEMIEAAPSSLLREEADATGMRASFEKMIREAQDSICAAIEEIDGTKFHEDAWTRPGGGGGISRVMQNGNVFEKAGINVSVVYGTMPQEAYRAATGTAEKGEGKSTEQGKAGRIPFFAAGISSVMHPKNPKAPTVHFNYRYFETDSQMEGGPRGWWFGGGTDLTPSYLFTEDAQHFHGTLKDTCDKHDEAFYPRFKTWCDEYFYNQHRGERRGIGGVFFDDMNDRDPEELLAFATDMANSVVPAYCPLVVKHKDDEFTETEKEWQQIRRGRYVEFNLVYDRGTTFGLKTGGRIESILMSLPLTARWEYDQVPEEGSEEEKLLEACRNPPDDWFAL
ncbi:Chloroperoxidase 1 [Cymbomonas tetramitiformis]|uniref:coproporphyrinogen oxidase n=1 Tax=Cymbomonas tetramitiformis TaxID=36881 RepID=A0AAE0G671_9CHLO|nr:Chloroperoxidase 1 [Cymbomonas tetramitiformis]